MGLAGDISWFSILSTYGLVNFEGVAFVGGSDEVHSVVNQTPVDCEDEL